HRNAVSTDGRHATEYGLVPRGGRRICLRFPQWKRLREWEGIRHPTSQPLDPQTPSASDVTDAIGQRKLVQPILAWTTRIRDSQNAQASGAYSTLIRCDLARPTQSRGAVLSPVLRACSRCATFVP